MKFLFRLILFIMVVLIFIFVFAGQGIFDSFLPLMEGKAIVTITFKGGVFDMGDNEYMVKKSESDKFLAYMLDNGYKLVNIELNEDEKENNSDDGVKSYSLEKNGETFLFEKEEVLKFFYKYKVD